jgi:hypothetical protein
LLLQLRRSFDALDHDHDGFITSADLLNLQQQLLGEHHITKELAEEMMSEVSSCIDESHDGKMNYQEVSCGGCKGIVCYACMRCTFVLLGRQFELPGGKLCGRCLVCCTCMFCGTCIAGQYKP